MSDAAIPLSTPRASQLRYLSQLRRSGGSYSASSSAVAEPPRAALRLPRTRPLDRLLSDSSTGGAALDPKPFLLAVKAIARDREGRILLLKRSEVARLYPGRWDLPGGKVDPGEPFDDAFIREVAEETGLSVDLAGVAGAAEFGLPTVRFAVLFMEARCTDGEIRLSGEHVAYRWASPSELADIDFSDELGEFMRSYAQPTPSPRSP